MPVWFDQVPCQPTVGVLTTPSVAFLDAPMAFADRVVRSWMVPPELKRTENSGVVADHPDGRRVVVDAENVLCSYQYRVVVAQGQGASPKLSVNELPPCSEAIRNLAREVQQSFAVLADLHLGRRARRTGVMIQARLDAGSLPPGVEAFRDRLVASIRHQCIQTDSSVLGVVAVTKTHLDRCHHRLSFDTSADLSEVRLVLDYQRVYSEEGRDWTDAQLGQVVETALTYFEGFGAGDWLA